MTQEELNKINYVKREIDKPDSGNGLKPVTFLLTQFHIIFVYPTNITILSNISQEIVYSKNFESIAIRSAVFDNLQKYILLLGNKDQIEYS